MRLVRGCARPSLSRARFAPFSASLLPASLRPQPPTAPLLRQLYGYALWSGDLIMLHTHLTWRVWWGGDVSSPPSHPAACAAFIGRVPYPSPPAATPSPYRKGAQCHI